MTSLSQVTLKEFGHILLKWWIIVLKLPNVYLKEVNTDITQFKVVFYNIPKKLIAVFSYGIISSFHSSLFTEYKSLTVFGKV